MNENKIISRQKWEDLISDIQKSIKEDLTDHSEAKELLRQAMVKAVEERLPDKKFGILFSGGVDSSLIALIAKKAGKDFICYTVGFQEGESKEPEDIVFAKKAAEQIGVKLKVKVLNLDEAHELFKKTVSVLGKELNNVVNVGVGSVEIACIETAKQDNVRYLFSGLGSEEIFAGYERHKLAENKQQECWKGLKLMYERDFLRDAAIATSEKIIFSTPFLDKELITLAMRIPDKFKISNENAKIILRESAQDLGLPKEFAWRKKIASQYGSRLDKAISKLAKKHGFEYKKDYLKSLE
ncbi:MAG: asparagine synthase C-terminal domain-containing protein [Nanoarchaeota archaeon]|nr:asparagine synthase C-terminal domain-containing protein [Nanoarchaeota archaeon]MBU1598365.1 asparagine synthase C-terminal domain-containing protein [Nanoarchaeota archaeon]MBU2441733.1 asparagine synthase C-terminal domain-containing protein [Nanoarchaeota archaeon]